MKFDFTDGEWIVNGENDSIYVNGKAICFFFDKLEYDCENKQANARLISKAPEMLEALIELFIEFEKDGQMVSDHIVKLIEEATGKKWEEINEI